MTSTSKAFITQFKMVDTFCFRDPDWPATEKNLEIRYAQSSRSRGFSLGSTFGLEKSPPAIHRDVLRLQSSPSRKSSRQNAIRSRLEKLSHREPNAKQDQQNKAKLSCDISAELG